MAFLRDDLIETITAVVSNNHDEILDKMYKELFPGKLIPSRNEIKDELLNSDYTSKWGFDCGLVYFDCDKSLLRDESNQKILVNKTTPSMLIINAALNIQSVTIQQSYGKQVIKLLNKEVPMFKNKITLHTWID